jgi:hypothetical protein
VATILGLGIQNRGRQEPNSADLFGLLPLSSERRKRETDSENDREPDPPHGTSVGLAGGSLADECCSEEWAALVEHALLDYLIRSQQQRVGNGDAERLGGLEVDHELELGGLLHRQVGRVGPLQDLVHVGCGPPV